MGNVQALSGARITKVLVANRGEIACRVFRTCRALGLGTVAVFSDADATLPHVAAADVAVRIGPGPASESYLDSERILTAAQRTGADAVHPGYGFLAENAAFAEQVQASGLTWIGPSPAAIRVMGDKARARRLAAEHGVPIVPGYDGDDQSDEAFARAAEGVGYPLLVKAAAGGGGRGMRRVEAAADLKEALASARREARAGFGDDTLLLERYVAQPRHIEVQVLGDAQGQVVHLFERECSIQRRHQKIVEEAPSPRVDGTLRERLGAAAVRVAEAVQYVGAGTVEFLVDAEGAFYFLEMNTRLQVEHPVTELITGRDLVADQIALARGEPFPLAQDELRWEGHAVEVRLYAEDPLRDYLPATGKLLRLDLPAEEGVRIDAGYASGDQVSPFYDSMLAKVIAFGPDRATAVQRLRRAVEQAWVPGLVTNLPLLREVLRHPAFERGELDTGFLTRHGLPTPPPLNLGEGALFATAWAWWLRRRAAPYPRGVPAGWRVSGPELSHDTWHCGDQEMPVSWRAREDALEVVTGLAIPVRVLDVAGDQMRVEALGVQRTVRIAAARADASAVGPLQDGDQVYVHFGDGEAFVALSPRFPPPAADSDEPGTCHAPTPGTVVAVHVAAGDAVTRGQTLLVLEAMKMEHSITAAEDGVVAQVRVAVGDTVDQGDLLVRLETEEATTSS